MPDIKSPFVQNQLNRFFGGHNAPRDPYVSGFFMVFFSKIPTFMETAESQVLTALATSVTLPDYTLDKVTANALGGLKFHVPGALTIGETFTLNFTEYQYMPVFNIIRKWNYAIRSNILGFANHSQLVGNDQYVQKNYKGAATIVYLRPDMKDIDFACVLTGIWPLKVPTAELNSEITAVEKKDLSVEFSCDLVFFAGDSLSEHVVSDSPTDWVYNNARSLVDGVRTGVDGTTEQRLYSADAHNVGGNS